MQIKRLSEILKNQESFESLHHKLLLFAKDSKFYSWSGYVTAALLDFEDDGGVPVTIIAINTYKAHGWLTIKRGRAELEEMLKSCIEVVGETEADSFTITHD